MNKYPMTRGSYEHLQVELKRLKTKDRHEISKEIEIARDHGDLSENAEYDAAKDKQGLIEARIRDLETKVAQAEVIDIQNLNSDKVVFGATVTLEDLDTDESLQIQIVGEDEADGKKGKISVHAPIARALIGKKEDDEVEVKAPGGSRFYEIKKIQFISDL